jgi:hypothetical protein
MHYNIRWCKKDATSRNKWTRIYFTRNDGIPSSNSQSQYISEDAFDLLSQKQSQSQTQTLANRLQLNIKPQFEEEEEEEDFIQLYSDSESEKMESSSDFIKNLFGKPNNVEDKELLSEDDFEDIPSSDESS